MTKKYDTTFTPERDMLGIKNFNRAREAIGVAKIEIKTRNCLKCRKQFKSMTRRICTPCRKAQIRLNHYTPEELYNG